MDVVAPVPSIELVDCGKRLRGAAVLGQLFLPSALQRVIRHLKIHFAMDVHPGNCAGLHGHAHRLVLRSECSAGVRTAFVGIDEAPVTGGSTRHYELECRLRNALS